MRPATDTGRSIGLGRDTIRTGLTGTGPTGTGPTGTGPTGTGPKILEMPALGKLILNWIELAIE